MFYLKISALFTTPTPLVNIPLDFINKNDRSSSGPLPPVIPSAIHTWWWPHCTNAAETQPRAPKKEINSASPAQVAGFHCPEAQTQRAVLLSRLRRWAEYQPTAERPKFSSQILSSSKDRGSAKAMVLVSSHGVWPMKTEWKPAKFFNGIVLPGKKKPWFVKQNGLVTAQLPKESLDPQIYAIRRWLLEKSGSQKAPPPSCQNSGWE